MVISPTLFVTLFGVIFLAELPDKTALAALLLAARHRPLPVFVGAGSRGGLRDPRSAARHRHVLNRPLTGSAFLRNLLGQSFELR